MFGLGVPSKFYNTLAAGKPILFIGPKGSEIAEVVREYRIGYCFEPGDDERIVAFIRSLSRQNKAMFQAMGERSRDVAEKVFGKEEILHQFYEFI